MCSTVRLKHTVCLCMARFCGPLLLQIVKGFIPLGGKQSEQGCGRCFYKHTVSYFRLYAMTFKWPIDLQSSTVLLSTVIIPLLRYCFVMQ